MSDEYFGFHIGTNAVTQHGAAIYLDLHEGAGRYDADFHRLEDPFLTQKAGEQVYFHAKPYYNEPEFQVVVALYHQPQGSAIGQVRAVRQVNTKHVHIGQAQAWFYPADRLLVLWECYLFDWCRTGAPAQDVRHVAVYQAFERWLITRCQPSLIVSPAWEPVYHKQLWQEFQAQQGYTIQGMRAVKRL